MNLTSGIFSLAPRVRHFSESMERVIVATRRFVYPLYLWGGCDHCHKNEFNSGVNLGDQRHNKLQPHVKLGS